MAFPFHVCMTALTVDTVQGLYYSKLEDPVTSATHLEVNGDSVYCFFSVDLKATSNVLLRC